MLTRTGRREVSTAGLLFSTTAGLWLALAPLLGHMGPPWPCFVAGAGILACVLMIWLRPEQRRGWAVLVLVLSITILLVGMDGIPPSLFGIAGGSFLLSWSQKSGNGG